VWPEGSARRTGPDRARRQVGKAGRNPPLRVGGRRGRRRPVADAGIGGGVSAANSVAAASQHRSMVSALSPGSLSRARVRRREL
jgi:hypothetical protein